MCSHLKILQEKGGTSPNHWYPDRYPGELQRISLECYFSWYCLWTKLTAHQRSMATQPSSSACTFSTTQRTFSSSNINLYYVFYHVQSLGKSVHENVRHLTGQIHEHFCLGTVLTFFLVPMIVGLVVGCCCHSRNFPSSLMRG